MDNTIIDKFWNLYDRCERYSGAPAWVVVNAKYFDGKVTTAKVLLTPDCRSFREDAIWICEDLSEFFSLFEESDERVFVLVDVMEVGSDQKETFHVLMRKGTDGSTTLKLFRNKESAVKELYSIVRAAETVGILKYMSDHKVITDDETVELWQATVEE